MSAQVIGWSALSPAGEDPASIAAAVLGDAPVADGVLEGEDLPGPPPRVVPDFSIRARLGRKGTSSMDRWTGMTVVACGEALRAAGIETDDPRMERIGVAIGTTAGGLRSTCDFSMQTLTEAKPYLVNPALFPNTVMNSAPGYAAIRYGLHGPNSAIAGGPLAFLQALRYATIALRQGYADLVLVGGVEELSPHRAWAAHRLAPDASVGEGAAVFLMAENPSPERGQAEVLGFAARFDPPSRDGSANGSGAASPMSECVRSVLARAEIDPGELRWISGTRAGLSLLADWDVLASAEVLDVEAWAGDAGAAGGALALAGLLSVHQQDIEADAAVSLLVAASPEGAYAAALVRGWHDGGADHG